MLAGLGCLCAAESQASDYLYRLHLTDKEGSNYCALTERAMARRERQGIELDEADRTVSPQYIDQIRQKGWQILTLSRWLNTVVVRRPDSAAIAETEFVDLPFVDHYEQIWGAQQTQEGASAPRQRKLLDAEEELAAQKEDNFRVPIQEVKGEALYDAGYRGKGMMIAVLDGGFYNVPDLPHFARKIAGWHDCYDAKNRDLWTSSVHGTQVLSMMATDPTYKVWGTAVEATYYLIRTEWADAEIPVEEDYWVAGAEIADSVGVDVINSSLGYSNFDDSAYDHTWDDLRQERAQISKGAAMACRKGILVCSSAGNERNKTWMYVNFPSDVEDVFVVGSTTSELQASSFTSVGWQTPYVKPDVSCRGTGAWLIDAKSYEPVVLNGTSYSCPMMCGLMASLWSANPNLLPSQLRQIVRQSASHHAHPTLLMGYGLPDFQKALEAVLSAQSSVAKVEVLEERTSSYDMLGRQTSGVKGLCIERGKVVLRR